MQWITQDPAFMGYIRECEGDESVDTHTAMINRAIKYLVQENSFDSYTIDRALAAAGFDLWDEPTEEELNYILSEAQRRHR